jgi:hypothetical protein
MKIGYLFLKMARIKGKVVGKLQRVVELPYCQKFVAVDMNIRDFRS